MLTNEQQEVVNTILSPISNNRIVTVNSVAGSGKTSTSIAVVDAYKPKNGFYTAFNKAIIESSKKRFKTISVKTIHALAYNYIKPKYGIANFNYQSITESIDYISKAIIINTLDSFYKSEYIDLEAFCDKVVDKEYKHIIPVILSYANKMLEDEIPITFNFMLKYLHLLLYDNKVTIEYDLFILDECQDVSAVTLEIFKLIKSKKKIIFGDTHQNIYQSFMETVNAFDLLEDTIDLRLTQSFRCSTDIANRVETFGIKYLDKNFVFKGNPNLDYTDDTEVYISRSNAELINMMDNLHYTNTKYDIVRDLKEIFSFPITLYMANMGKPVLDVTYKFLEIEYKKYSSSMAYTEFFSYLEDTFSNDNQIKSSINLLRKLRNKKVNIYDVQKTAKQMLGNKKTILSTTHAFKGLEVDRVHMLDDLNSSIDSVIPEYELWKEAVKELPIQPKAPKTILETFNTYYVAISRARYELNNARHA